MILSNFIEYLELISSGLLIYAIKLKPLRQYLEFSTNIILGDKSK